MKGKYKNAKGQTLEIVEHDVSNKSVMVTVNGRGCEWYPEKEVENWESLDTETISESETVVLNVEPFVEMKDEDVAEVEEVKEKPKKKKATTKKK